MLKFDPSNLPEENERFTKVKKYIMLRTHSFLRLNKDDIIYICLDKEDPGNHSRFIIYNSKGNWVTNTTGFRDEVGVLFADYKAVLRNDRINQILDIIE